MKIESYDLDLDVDFQKATVKATVGITVQGAGTPFLLDSSTLTIRSVKVDGKPARFVQDKPHRKLKIYSVPRRRSVVEVSYEKRISDDSIFGLYKAKYGKEYMISTDLEPSEARTVFPCVDEPLYKAVFRLQITTQKGLSVISNTPAARVELTDDGRTRTVFEETPRMSTYLLYLGIGKMEELQVESDGIDVIAATRPGQAKDSKFALDVVAAVLKDYQKYFDVPYPLPKLHVVAVPEYHTGAMENWGAIASRESRVLINDDSSFYERFKAAATLIHEVGHMWFGDLVTMKWWDDLWLNESFATLMEYKMLARLHPDWQVWDAFLRDEVFPAMSLDSLPSTHPVQVKVKTVEEATHLFDIVSYNKGAAVLRMIESHIGEESFRKGVSAYLKKFQYSNATGSDLWRALGASSRRPVTSIARAWLTKAGFPVVRVTTDGDKIRLTQSQFRMTGKPRGLWPIPVEMRVDGEKKSLLLSKKSATIRRHPTSELLVNLDRVGYYAVLYDEEGWRRVADGFSGLSSRDRAGIMSDLYLFMKAGTIDPEVYFKFVALAGQNLDTLATETTAQQLPVLRDIADESSLVRSAYQSFYPPLLAQLGEARRPGEPEVMGATREILTTEYAKADLTYARKLAPMFGDYAHLDPNLREAVAISYAMVNGERAKGPLLKLVKGFQSEVDRGKIYSALSSFRDPRLVEETLELVFSGEVPRSDSAYPIMNGGRNPLAREVFWQWLKKRYDQLREMYGGSQQFYIYMAMTIPFCGVGREADVRRFISGKRLREGGSTYKRVMENLAIHDRLRDRLLAAGKHE